MKRVIVFIVVALSLGSCKKEYNCSDCIQVSIYENGYIDTLFNSRFNCDYAKEYNGAKYYNTSGKYVFTAHFICH